MPFPCTRFTVTALSIRTVIAAPHPISTEAETLPIKIDRSDSRLANSVARVCRSRSPANESGMVIPTKMKGIKTMGMKDIAL